MSLFFPRGNGPLVSVLIPSRGNPELLIKAVSSIIRQATRPNSIEVLVKADDDDPETIEASSRLHTEHNWPVGTIISSRGNGYWDIHHYLNMLAAQARGDWLFVFNDDATIETKGWDTLLFNHQATMCWHGLPGDIMMLSAEMIGTEGSNDFFMLRRKTYELLGHVCLSSGGDIWLSRLMGIVCSTSRIPIKVSHDRDPERVQRSVKPPEWVGPLIMSSHMVANQLADALKLIAHIQADEASAVWRDKPPNLGWCRFRNSWISSSYNAYVHSDKAVSIFDWTGKSHDYELEGLIGQWSSRSDLGIPVMEHNK